MAQPNRTGKKIKGNVHYINNNYLHLQGNNMFSNICNFEFLLHLKDLVSLPPPMFLDALLGNQDDPSFEEYLTNGSLSYESRNKFVSDIQSNLVSDSPFTEGLPDISIPQLPLDCFTVDSPFSAGVGIDENRFENLMSENNYSVQTSVFVREKQGKFILSNNSPAKFHKLRRFEVKVPKIGYSYQISIKLTPVECIAPP